MSKENDEAQRIAGIMARNDYERSADPMVLRAVVESYKAELAEAVRLLRMSLRSSHDFSVGGATHGEHCLFCRFLAKHPKSETKEP